MISAKEKHFRGNYLILPCQVDAYIWEEFIYHISYLRLYESLLVQCRAFHISISVLSKCIQLGWISHETCMIWAEGENLILEGNVPVLHITGEGGGGVSHKSYKSFMPGFSKMFLSSSPLLKDFLWLISGTLKNACTCSRVRGGAMLSPVMSPRVRVLMQPSCSDTDRLPCLCILHPAEYPSKPG